MRLDATTCEKARLSRDARFDGRFFVGVVTTGIYCRPICPAPAPKSRNVRFFPSAAAAAEAGLRPCLRCRPESSPGTPAWLGTSATVSRALVLIDSGALDDGSVAELSGRLGIGPRHLSRLFHEHVGAPPVAIAQTRRLLFAKKLIDETDLPMAEIAFSAGFGSVRRFNALFHQTYGRRPSALRRLSRSDPTVSASPSTGARLVLSLAYRPPFDWPALVAFLAPRAIPGVELVTADAYRRTIRFDRSTGLVEVRPAAEGDRLELSVRFPDSRQLLRIVARVRRLFDLGADPVAITGVLGRDRILKPLVRARPGLRVPGSWDGFELAVRAILGQQVTVRGATALSGRFVRAFGEPLDEPIADDLDRLFPTAEELADADIESIGLPKTRAAAIRRLAQVTVDGATTFQPAGAVEESTERLVRLPGVGDWTAQYIAMRALGEPDAFPASDLGLLKAAASRTESGSRLTPARLRKMAEAWRPWRAYAAMHLWSSAARDRTPGRAASPATPYRTEPLETTDEIHLC